MGQLHVCDAGNIRCYRFHRWLIPYIRYYRFYRIWLPPFLCFTEIYRRFILQTSKLCVGVRGAKVQCDKVWVKRSSPQNVLTKWLHERGFQVQKLLIYLSQFLLEIFTPELGITDFINMCRYTRTAMAKSKSFIRRFRFLEWTVESSFIQPGYFLWIHWHHTLRCHVIQTVTQIRHTLPPS